MRERPITKPNKEQGELNISEFVPSDNKMYCFTVPSGMLLLRRNNRVFVSGYDKEANKLIAYCIDRANGKILWQYDLR